MQDEDAETSAESLLFHYIKSAHFRVVHAEGVHGGPAPNGRGINANFFSERLPIPQRTQHAVIEGRLGDEQRDARVSKEGVIREVEVSVWMDLPAAKALITWLQRHVEAVEAMTETAQTQHGEAL